MDKVILIVDFILGYVLLLMGMIGMVIYSRGIGLRKVDSKEFY